MLKMANKYTHISTEAKDKFVTFKFGNENEDEEVEDELVFKIDCRGVTREGFLKFFKDIYGHHSSILFLENYLISDLSSGNLDYIQYNREFSEAIFKQNDLYVKVHFLFAPEILNEVLTEFIDWFKFEYNDEYDF